MNTLDFTFSEMIAGYIKSANNQSNEYHLETSDGRDFTFVLTDTTFAELIRNLGESYIDCTAQMKDMLQPGRHIFVYGIFYPDNNCVLEAKHVVFSGKRTNEFVFEKQDWWIAQIRQLGDFYLKAQFEGGPVDFSNYRTMLNLYGNKMDSTRQETDTISRLIYGLASAYLLTGDDKYLEAAEAGSKYLQDHFCMVDKSENICYWYHAIEFGRNHSKKILCSKMPDVPGFRKANVNNVWERKMIASEFGDDYDAIPAYEQIYALAGLAQTYRVTGNKSIRESIDRTLNLFDRYFKDHVKGGYFSHIDPITFDPRSESLGKNQARKNWNSVGDHAPAYLINVLLATGEEKHKELLIDTADTIAAHFQDYEHSTFIQEKFHEDWSHDYTWGWQQNRSVMGHNLKIAWNLTRIYNLNNNNAYLDFAKKIASLMPKNGGDALRGGWYDVLERKLEQGQTAHRFAWHDRKAWWQQEQGILAYLIMYGVLKDPDYLKQARESSAFYNAWFLDQDAGAVYFNVLANGLPYLLGTERTKGSHAMSGYHSFELCYLASVYTNLLITKQPMDFYFKPYPNSLQGNILRVAPDLLPVGSIKIDSVWINGDNYTDFDADQLTVKLPNSESRLKVRVRIVPTSGLDHFSVSGSYEGAKAVLKLSGTTDALAIPILREELEKVIDFKPATFVVDMSGLKEIDHIAVRSLIFTKQKLATNENMIVIGANKNVRAMMDVNELSEEVTFQ